MSVMPDIASGFSLNPELIGEILTHAKPLGHNERPEQLNLGFGYLYYGLIRSLQPRHVVVIGSGHGFSVVCLALALKDNGAGKLTFVDPSYSLLRDGPFKTVGGIGNWDSEHSVREHFARFGVEDVVTHYKMRSEDFFQQYAGLGLPPVDVGFIDGNHSLASVKHDVVSAVRHARRNSYLLLHDTNIYIREVIGHAGVKRWLNRLRREPHAFEVVDFPFASGVAVVRVVEPSAWAKLQ